MHEPKDKSWIAGALLALTASLCCLTPVLALLSGVSGVAAMFSFLEPARPYLISVTVLILGFAWYQKLKWRKKEEIECACEEEEKPAFWHSKTFLGIVTVLVIALLTFPGYSHIFYSNKEKSFSVRDALSSKVVEFSISGMTCAGCEEHVKQAVNAVSGVLVSSANHQSGTASATFDQSKVSVDQIVDAINATGYKVEKYEIRNDDALNPVSRQAGSVIRIELNVSGMTCSACEEHVKHSVNELDGIIEVSTSYKQGKAIVSYDASKTTPGKITEAINRTGYKVVDK